MSDPAPANAPQSFEAALAELEELVGAMESGQLSLEQSLAAHRRGLELTRYCQNALAQAQQQVRILEEETLRSFAGVQPNG
jgi:exodeoxyribonuclease VII small subunit